MRASYTLTRYWAILDQENGLFFTLSAHIFIITINIFMIKYREYWSEYQALLNARQRCFNSKIPNYANYGGRGITVHPDWCGPGGFQRFFEHIGPKPSPDLTLDRLDNEKGYEPGNVGWRSMKDQIANRRPYRARKPIYGECLNRDRNAQIRVLRKAGHTVADIALRYELSQSQVYRVLRCGK